MRRTRTTTTKWSYACTGCAPPRRAGPGGQGGRPRPGGAGLTGVLSSVQVTQPFILRRTKRDVEKQLTKKYEHVLKCRLSSRQKALYEDVVLQPG